MSQIKKSSFSITCDRLSQYIKEKKSFPVFGGINLNAPAQDSEATLELFPLTDLNKPFTAKSGTKQLTILYNGKVVNYENIEAINVKELTAFATSINTLEKVELDIVMPMARRKSLQQFLQKRKDRIKSNAPYSSKQEYNEKSWLQLAL